MHHFNQGRPDDTIWKLWFKANLLWSDGKNLTEPLGAWLTPHVTQQQSSPAYYNWPDCLLYLPMPDQQFKKFSLTGELMTPDDGLQIVDTLPRTALPTRIRADSSWIQPAQLPTLYSGGGGLSACL
jgi:hypothetical protein